MFLEEVFVIVKDSKYYRVCYLKSIHKQLFNTAVNSTK